MRGARGEKRVSQEGLRLEASDFRSAALRSLAAGQACSVGGHDRESFVGTNRPPPGLVNDRADGDEMVRRSRALSDGGTRSAECRQAGMSLAGQRAITATGL